MSFLGLGVRPPTPSWGSILNDGFCLHRESQWPAIAGGLPIVRRDARASRFSAKRSATSSTRGSGRTRDGGRPCCSSVEHLSVDFRTAAGRLHALRDVNLDGDAGRDRRHRRRIRAAASRPSINAVIGLLPPMPKLTAGRIGFNGADLLTMHPDELRAAPRRSHHRRFPGSDDRAQSRALDRDADDRNPVSVRAQPGGQARPRRRVFWRRSASPTRSGDFGTIRTSSPAACGSAICIAMALMPEPDLLIADEPTTALDATLEVQVIHLLKDAAGARSAAPSSSSRIISASWRNSATGWRSCTPARS